MRETEILEQMTYSCFTNNSELSLKKGQTMRYQGVYYFDSDGGENVT